METTRLVVGTLVETTTRAPAFRLVVGKAGGGVRVVLVETRKVGGGVRVVVGGNDFWILKKSFSVN